jgi:hypothetical protein
MRGDRDIVKNGRKDGNDIARVDSIISRATRPHTLTRPIVVDQSALEWSACRQPRSRAGTWVEQKKACALALQHRLPNRPDARIAVAAAAPPYFLAGPRLASLKTSGILSAARFAPRASAAVRPSASRSAADGTSITQPSPWRRAVTLVRAGDDK